MARRGWSKERAVRTVCTTGEIVDVVSGITTVAGRRVVALAISSARDSGPTAVLTEMLAGRVLANVRMSHADLIAEARRSHESRGSA